MLFITISCIHSRYIFLDKIGFIDDQYHALYRSLPYVLDDVINVSTMVMAAA